jgi:hypothetical protein
MANQRVIAYPPEIATLFTTFAASFTGHYLSFLFLHGYFSIHTRASASESKPVARQQLL